MRRLHGAGRRRAGLFLHPADRHARGQGRHDAGGHRDGSGAPPAAGGHPGRAGGPVRLLPVGHHRLGQSLARQAAAPEPRRDRRSARSPPLPLRLPHSHRARGRARRSDPSRRGTPMIRNTLPLSLLDHPRLDQWIAFEPGGTVRLATGKVEIGQGILTALAQIAAEELDVAPERLRLTSGETGRTPNEGYTAGSLSTEVSGGSIRLVCADVRARFVDLAAAGLACPPDELSVEDGRFLRQGQETGLDYWALAERVDLGHEVRDNIA